MLRITLLTMRLMMPLPPRLLAVAACVEEGAVASLGFDYYQVGVQTADYVVAILQGTAPGKLDVKFAQGSDLVINEDAAIRLGISIPDSVLSRASMIK